MAGIKYQLHACGTNLEGEWEEVMGAIQKCHYIVHAMGAARISSSFQFETRCDKVQSMEDILYKVQRKISLLNHVKSPSSGASSTFSSVCDAMKNTSSSPPASVAENVRSDSPRISSPSLTSSEGSLGTQFPSMQDLASAGATKSPLGRSAFGKVGSSPNMVNLIDVPTLEKFSGTHSSFNSDVNSLTILNRPCGITINSLAPRDQIESNAHMIIPKLWLGNESAACSPLSVLKKHSIGCILTVGFGIKQIHQKDIEYHRVKAIDLPVFNIIQFLPECMKFISEGMSSGNAVLVHCKGGISRSASIVLGFLMARDKISFEESLWRVRQACGGIEIDLNFAFKQQLKLWEQMGYDLNGTSNAHQIYVTKWRDRKMK